MAASLKSAPNLEMLTIADAVSREKSITREEVLEAMAQAVARAGKQKYGPEYDIRATIDPKTGEMELSRHREVVAALDDEEHANVAIILSEAKFYQESLEIGDFLVEPLPPIDLGRIAAQSAKQVIVQKVRESERAVQFEDFKDRKGEIINGLVKRVEFGNVTVDLGRSETTMRRDELIPRELFRVGDRIRAYIFDVREEQRGPQVFLSRTHPVFLAKLFAMEVPEIYEGVVEIKSVARDPGSRAKIAVISNDSAVDPVGACVGMRGSRVQAVVKELQGEKIDIIPWTEDQAGFVVNALQPAEVSRIVMDEEAGRVEVVVPDEQLSLAIGRRGQNVRLASNLTGWEIDISTEAEDSEKRQREFQERTALFAQALDADEFIANLLATEGFADIDDVANADPEALAMLDGFDGDLAGELHSRATAFVEQREADLEAKWRGLGVQDDLVELEIFGHELLIALGEANIKTRDDLADLAADELQEILATYSIDEEDAQAIIMAARAHWFDDEEFEGEGEDGEGVEGEQDFVAEDVAEDAASEDHE